MILLITFRLYSALICCPFERVQTLLQDSSNNRRFKHTWEIVKILPYREYYRGIRPILLRNGVSTFIYFHVSGLLEPEIRKISENQIVNDFIRGAIGGICATTYAYVFNVVKSRQQAVLDHTANHDFRR